MTNDSISFIEAMCDNRSKDPFKRISRSPHFDELLSQIQAASSRYETRGEVHQQTESINNSTPVDDEYNQIHNSYRPH